jgi:hypothetical protein
VEHIDRLLKAAKKSYDKGQDPLAQLETLAVECLTKLKSQAIENAQHSLEGKEYVILNAGTGRSRPILPSLFIKDPADLKAAWKEMVNAIDPKGSRIAFPKRDLLSAENLVNQVIYTAVMSFAACYDIWKPKSRKTPGTYFEVILGTLLGKLLPDHIRGKHIILEESNRKIAVETDLAIDPSVAVEPDIVVEVSTKSDPTLSEPKVSVSTDIVFAAPKKPGLVFPAKITTRERIVQAYAHQRILDSFYGEDRFRSILLCISETQRDDVNSRVNDICVPGTIRLFQRHLASLDFICYADPPTRYLQDDVTELVQVKTLGWLFVAGLPTISSRSHSL